METLVDYSLTSLAVKLCMFLHPPDKPKLVQYARKIDLKSHPFGQLMSGKV